MSDAFYLDAEPYKGGDDGFYLDAEPYKEAGATPSLGDAIQQGGKNLLTGAAGLADMAGVAMNPAQYFTGKLFGTSQPTLRETVDKAIPETVGGPVADIVKAAQEASLFPMGGPVANALAGAGAEVAHQMAPDSAIAPLAGALIPGAVGVAVGAPIKAISTGLRNRSMGLTARDYASAASQLDLGTVGRGKERLLEALQTVEDDVRAGIPGWGAAKWYAQLGRPTESFITKTIKAAAAANEPNAKAVGRIIAQADDALGGAEVAPNRDLIDNALSRLSSLDREKVGARVKEYGKALTKDTGGKAGGTMTQMQQEKLGLNAVLESQPREQMAQNIWRRSVRSSLEEQADALAKEGRIAAKAGDLAKVNAKFGAMEELIKGLGKDLPTAQAADLAEQIRRAGFTTSGLGLQGMRVANEAIPGLGVVGALASMASYFTPVGRVLGQAGRDIGGLIKGASPAQKLLAAAAIAAAHESGEGGANLSDQTVGGGDSGLDEPLQDGKADKQKNKPKKDSEQPPHATLFNPTGNANQEDSAKTLAFMGRLFGGSNAGIATLFGGNASKKNGADMNPKYEKTVEKVMPALFKAESNNNPKAESPAGAQGLGQLMPETGREWHKKLGLPGKYDPFDAEQNATISTEYYAWLLEQFGGDAKLALAAYNHGIGNVKKKMSRWGKDFKSIYPRLPAETQAYVAKISRNAGLA